MGPCAQGLPGNCYSELILANVPCFLEKKDVIQAFHLDNQTERERASDVTQANPPHSPEEDSEGLVCTRRSQAGQRCSLSMEGTPFYAGAPSLRHRGAASGSLNDQAFQQVRSQPEQNRS